MSAQSRERTLLVVGGLDPSGGAGVLVDAQAGRSLGLHVAAVVALVTVQDGREFSGAQPVESGLVREGMETVLASQDVGAVKTGALGAGEIVSAVVDLAGHDRFPPLVVDPVLASTSGGELIDRRGVELVREALMPAAAVVTPNAREAAALSGRDVDDLDGAVRAAERLVELGARAVLVKGGHLTGDRVVDVLVRPGEPVVTLAGPRVAQGARVRGTGCALASLIAGRLALGDALEPAVAAAREALTEALGRARRIGSGPPVLGLD
jgi:hydroxymethylpyrimidine/phosphomethylpyrimidine kinase